LRRSPDPSAADPHSSDRGHRQPANDTATPIGSITIPHTIWDQLTVHLRQALPNEGCGLLAAAGRRDDCLAIHFFPGTNEQESPSRYRMAGKEVIDALRTIRERGWWLAAIVHSHPTGPTTPSPTDLREANYPESALMIVDLSGAEPGARAWQVSGGLERTAIEIKFRVS
jgi:proteasome lid subunit RPN8/RPN11